MSIRIAFQMVVIKKSAVRKHYPAATLMSSCRSSSPPA